MGPLSHRDMLCLAGYIFTLRMVYSHVLPASLPSREALAADQARGHSSVRDDTGPWSLRLPSETYTETSLGLASSSLPAGGQPTVAVLSNQTTRLQRPSSSLKTSESQVFLTGQPQNITLPSLPRATAASVCPVQFPGHNLNVWNRLRTVLEPCWASFIGDTHSFFSSLKMLP